MDRIVFVVFCLLGPRRDPPGEAASTEGPNAGARLQGDLHLILEKRPLDRIILQHPHASRWIADHATAGADLDGPAGMDSQRLDGFEIQRERTARPLRPQHLPLQRHRQIGESALLPGRARPLQPIPGQLLNQDRLIPQQGLLA